MLEPEPPLSERFWLRAALTLTPQHWVAESVIRMPDGGRLRLDECQHAEIQFLSEFETKIGYQQL